MNDIEVKDWFIGESSSQVSQVNKARKIRFRKSSFTAIYNTFKDFIRRNAINIVDEKLEKAKKDLVNVEVTRGDNVENHEGTTNKEKKIEKKAQAIVKLSNIINFLERKDYPKAAAEDNRPLRLKKIMEEGLRKNLSGLEVIPEEEKANVEEQINEVINSTQQSIDEETKILNEKIDSILVKEDSKEETENFKNISVEDVKDTVDSVFESEEKKEAVEENKEEVAEESKEINVEDVKNAVEETFENNEEKKEEATEETIVTPIENIEKRNIGKITLPAATNEKDINSDIFNAEEAIKVEETKEETKTEEEREMPVVVPTREEAKNLENIKEDIAKSQEAFNELSNTSIDDKEKRDKLTKEIVELEKEIAEKSSELTEDELNALKEEVSEEAKEETVVEENEETEVYTEEDQTTVEETKEEEKEESKEIPEEENIGFDFSDASLEDIKKAAENSNSKKDLEAMMNKINKIKMLQKEAEKTSLQRTKAIEEEASKEKELEEAYKRLDKYSDELEKKCNQYVEETNEIKNRVREKDEAINSMLKIIDGIDEKSTSKRK